MASIPHRAGPRRVKTSGLRSEISAQLVLDSELPGQQAASVRSAKATGATRPISATSPSLRPQARLSLPHCRSPAATGRPKADPLSTLSKPEARELKMGIDPRPQALPYYWLRPHSAAQSTHTTNRPPNLFSAPIGGQARLLIGCLQPDEPVSLGSLVRIQNSCF